MQLESVGRQHRRGRRSCALLHDLSVDVWAGEVLAIRGARRSGKTTLLRIAAGIELPDAGTIRLDGCDLACVSSTERTQRLRGVGYAPRAWRVARGKPVVDHVALPLLAAGRPPATALAKAHEVMERVGALDCIRAGPRELSPGELARVSLARALVHAPRVLLVDEPAVTAEAEEREEILRLLRSIAVERADLAIVVTSRDVVGLSGAQRVMSLVDGRLRSFDEPASIVPFPARSGAQPESVL